MVAGEIGLGAVALVHLGDASADAARNGGLLHRDGHDILRWLDGGPNLVGEKLHRGGGNLVSFAQGQVCGEGEAAPAVGLGAGNALADDRGGAVGGEGEAPGDEAPEAQHGVGNAQKRAKRVALVGHGHVPGAAEEGRHLGGVDLAAGAVGQAAEERKKGGVLQARRGVAGVPHKRLGGGVHRDGAAQQHRRAARRGVVARGAQLRHQRHHVGGEARRQLRHELGVAGAGLGHKFADGNGELVASGELVG